MANFKKIPLPFDKTGGVTGAIQNRLFDSDAYASLSLTARELMRQIQRRWSNFKPVDFGTRQAAEVLKCDRKIAMRAFGELQDGGFIRLAEESQFNSRTGSKARSWICTWLPYLHKAPTNDWEKPPKANESTGG